MPWSIVPGTGASVADTIRAQQNAVWQRAELTNRVRSLLKAFFAAAWPEFEGA